MPCPGCLYWLVPSRLLSTWLVNMESLTSMYVGVESFYHLWDLSTGVGSFLATFRMNCGIRWPRKFQETRCFILTSFWHCVVLVKENVARTWRATLSQWFSECYILVLNSAMDFENSIFYLNELFLSSAMEVELGMFFDLWMRRPICRLRKGL